MHFYPLLLVHTCAGSAGFLAGTAAMILRKGSRRHQLSGRVFFGSMLILSLSGAYMAAFIHPVAINVVAGLLSFYLVATAWLTIVRKEDTTGATELGLLLLALLVGSASLSIGWEKGHAMPAERNPIYFVFGAVALLGATLDARMLARGGIFGVQRIRRHLWRMCLAFYIVVNSTFLGTPRNVLLPAVLRDSSFVFLPGFIVLGAMIFWLWRMRSRRSSVVGSTSQAMLG